MLVQAIGQLVLAGIGWAAFRLYRRPYLAILAASWLALAVYQGNGALSLTLGPPIAPDAPDAPGPSVARLLTSLIGSFASFAQIAWLLLGVIGLTRGRTITWRAFLIPTLVALMLGFATWYVSINSDAAGRYLMRVGVRSGLAALAFAASATLVLWARRRSLGRWLVASGFAIYALDLVQYCVATLPATTGHYSVHLGYVDILAQMMTGLGLVI